MASFAPPQPITATVNLDEFDSGLPELDIWLKSRALNNELSGASRTFVATVDNRVVGYYALSVGSITHEQAPGKIRRNMPDPIPAAVLARLATDVTCRGIGMGGGLLKDAVRRTLMAAETLGIRAMLVHALTPDARSFYERYGFTRSPVEDMTLMANLSDLRKAFSG